MRHVGRTTENARLEDAGQSKMQGWKMRDWKMRNQYAWLENARLENGGNDIVWNNVYSLCVVNPAG